jgi:hypothetical protein
MQIQNNVPMVKNSNQVHTTNDYFIFKPIDGNRNKNLLHINRLKKSMAKNYLYTIITVNEKHEIIDGQHRFDVIQELNLPLHYVVCNGYGLNEVHILNQNSKTWNADDYLEGYCNLGYNDYIQYKEFKDEYKIGHFECMSILSDNITKKHVENFYKGEFKITNYAKGCDTINKIFMLANYYEGYKRRSFIFAMLQLFKNKNFEFTEFLQKIKTQPTALVDCTGISSYVTLIEEIYNYRRREKVNLRY